MTVSERQRTPLSEGLYVPTVAFFTDGDEIDVDPDEVAYLNTLHEQQFGRAKEGGDLLNGVDEDGEGWTVTWVTQGFIM